jgi:peptidoglycan hydrolase-like protein with peptidoglycan-binding domain
MQNRPSPPPVPTPSQPNITESDLTPAQWLQIQQSLEMLGFSPGLIDGKPGRATRTAIRRFQAKTDPPPTGRLTSKQIDLLLKALSTTKSQH